MSLRRTALQPRPPLPPLLLSRLASSSSRHRDRRGPSQPPRPVWGPAPPHVPGPPRPVGSGPAPAPPPGGAAPSSSPVPPRRGRGNWRPRGPRSAVPLPPVPYPALPTGALRPFPWSSCAPKSPPIPERKVAGPARHVLYWAELRAEAACQATSGAGTRASVYPWSSAPPFLKERAHLSPPGVAFTPADPPRESEGSSQGPPPISFSLQHRCCTLNPTPQPLRINLKPATAVGGGALKSPQPVSFSPRL